MNPKTTRDPTQNGERVIALAYQAMHYTPSQESFRRGAQKKTYNPIHTAPVLNQVVTHLDLAERMAWGKQRARAVVREEAAAQYINSLQTPVELSEFLATLSLFLKTTATKERKAMQQYQDKAQRRLPPDQLVQTAYQIVGQFRWRSANNLNKLTKFAGRINGARSKWECLAVLAQYYPLRGMDQNLINRLVEELCVLEVSSFRTLVNQLLVFYSADQAKLT